MLTELGYLADDHIPLLTPAANIFHSDQGVCREQTVVQTHVRGARRRNVVRSEQKRVGCKRDLFATNSTRKGPNTVSKTQTPPSAPKPAPNIQVSDGSY